MKRILVPCDFSEPAIQAFEFAMNLAEKSNAEVFVLKVLDLPFIYESGLGSTPDYFDPGVFSEIESEARKSFGKMRSKFNRKDMVHFSTQQGSVTNSIIQFVDENKIDLIVMGTLGASGMKEYWIGSNTEKVVRVSPVPVLAVKKSFDVSTIKNIVLPTILQLDKHDFIAHVKELQSFFSATLHLLLINTPSSMIRTKEEMDKMEAYAKHYNLHNFTINIRNDFNEEDGIINFADEIKADMIAMGTRGRRGLAHLFLGSVTEDVVNHVNCPIWTYRIKKES